VLVASNIVDAALAGRSFRSITLTFSEAVDQAAFSITAVQLIAAQQCDQSAEYPIPKSRHAGTADLHAAGGG